MFKSRIHHKSITNVMDSHTPSLKFRAFFWPETEHLSDSPKRGCPESWVFLQYTQAPIPLTRWESQAVINTQTDHFRWPGTTIIFFLFLGFAQTQQEANLGL